MATSASSQQPQRPSRGRIAAQWFGVLGPPAAAFADQQLSYALVDLACRRDAPLLMLLPAGLSIVILGAAAALAWHGWQESRRLAAGKENTVIGAAQFYAIVGLALSGLSLGLILAQSLPDFFLHPCQR